MLTPVLLAGPFGCIVVPKVGQEQVLEEDDFSFKYIVSEVLVHLNVWVGLE